MAEIHFGTDGWRAIIGEDFTNDNLVRVIDAAARVFKEDAVAAVRTTHPARWSSATIADRMLTLTHSWRPRLPQRRGSACC